MIIYTFSFCDAANIIAVLGGTMRDGFIATEVAIAYAIGIEKGRICSGLPQIIKNFIRV